MTVFFLAALSSINCGNTCDHTASYGTSTTCGLICYTGSLGSVGSTGPCSTSSTFCSGGTYTIIRNTYSTVNYDCDNGGGYGCGSMGGCCVRAGDTASSSANNYYCITCNPYTAG